MTAYVCDTPWTLGHPEPLYFLWADDADEAYGAAYAAGLDDPQPSAHHNAFDCYLLTVDQMAEAIIQGVAITDKWGVVEWCSRRDGREDRLRVIAELRAKGE